MPPSPAPLVPPSDRTIMPRCVSRIDAAKYLGVSVSLFDREVKAGNLPAPITIGRRHVWDIRRIDAVVDSFADVVVQAANPWDAV